jgi:hypothetical protein
MSSNFGSGFTNPNSWPFGGVESAISRGWDAHKKAYADNKAHTEGVQGTADQGQKHAADDLEKRPRPTMGDFMQAGREIKNAFKGRQVGRHSTGGSHAAPPPPKDPW